VARTNQIPRGQESAQSRPALPASVGMAGPRTPGGRWPNTVRVDPLRCRLTRARISRRHSQGQCPLRSRAPRHHPSRGAAACGRTLRIGLSRQRFRPDPAAPRQPPPRHRDPHRRTRNRTARPRRRCGHSRRGERTGRGRLLRLHPRTRPALRQTECVRRCIPRVVGRDASNRVSDSGDLPEGRRSRRVRQRSPGGRRRCRRTCRRHNADLVVEDFVSVWAAQ
jgi:hypothetical protein